MNTSNVKALLWLTALALTAGLGWYVYDYVQHVDERHEFWDVELAKSKLQDVERVEEQKVDRVSAREVELAFYPPPQGLNWTGKQAPKPVVEVEQPQDTTPQVVPVADILRVQYVQEDARRPEHSRAYVRYKNDPRGQKKPAFPDELAVGDRLIRPWQYVRIQAIDAQEGVTFAFDDEAREHESLNVSDLDMDLGKVVVMVDEDGVRRPTQQVLPRSEGLASAWDVARTRQVDSNTWAIGREDMTEIGEDYPQIISREVRHRRHRDPRTGRYDGIELQDVKAGGVAARHGAQSGDVIKSINGHPVTSVAEATQFVRTNQDKYSVWEVVVENMGRERTMTYRTPGE